MLYDKRLPHVRIPTENTEKPQFTVIYIIVIHMHHGVYKVYKPQRPKAVAHKHSEGTTKSLRIYKLRRLHGACV